jgi:DNA primase
VAPYTRINFSRISPGRLHLSYNRDQPVWRCWHCGESGDWIAYLKKTKGLDFKEAVLQLAQAAGFDVSRYDQSRYHDYTCKADILETAQSLFIETLQQDAGSAVKEYLLRRGYSETDIDVMEVGAYTSRFALQKHLKGLGFAEKKIRNSGLLTAGFGETHTLIIPWEDAAGRTVGLVGRTVLPAEQVSAKGIPKYKYSAGLVKSEGLIGFTGIRGAETIVLAEGVLDARYLNSKGFKAASIGGSDLSLAQIKLLERSGAKEVLLAFDMDEAGREGTARAVDLLSRSRCRPYVVSLPRDSKILMSWCGHRAGKRSRRRSKTRSAGSVGTRAIFAAHMTSPPAAVWIVRSGRRRLLAPGSTTPWTGDSFSAACAPQRA